MRTVKLGDRIVGEGTRCLIMVDAGVNHNNDPERAIELIRAAARARADVIKFQTYKAETITTRNAERYWNPKLDTDGGGTQFDTFSRIDGLPLEVYSEMKKVAKECNIVLSSTPFSPSDVDELEKIDLDFYKIASADLVDYELLRKVNETGKPVVLSTGCGTVAEIEEAVNVLSNNGVADIVLQHCILSYPCADHDANLNKMKKLAEIFSEIPVGYSDHTEGITITLAAIAMGARTVEKHFTIDKSLPDSPDHSFSLDPTELADLVSQRDRLFDCFGTFVSGPYPAEEKANRLARKSVVSTTDIQIGEVITADMIACKRPGMGIPTKHRNFVIGRKAKSQIGADNVIFWQDLE